MEESIMGMAMGALAIVTLFIDLPWVIMHYVTRWKTAATLTSGDEALLEELHDLARRLDERMCTLERIMPAENPNWRAIACDPASTGIEDRTVSNQPSMRIGR